MYELRLRLHWGPINDIPTLVQIMAWCRPGDKSLSEPMMVNLLSHICVIRPQWAKNSSHTKVHSWPKTAQIKKTLGSTSNKYRSDFFAPGRYLIDIDPRVFAIWEYSHRHSHVYSAPGRVTLTAPSCVLIYHYSYLTMSGLWRAVTVKTMSVWMLFIWRYRVTPPPIGWVHTQNDPKIMSVETFLKIEWCVLK